MLRFNVSTIVETSGLVNAMLGQDSEVAMPPAHATNEPGNSAPALEGRTATLDQDHFTSRGTSDLGRA